MNPFRVDVAARLGLDGPSSPPQPLEAEYDVLLECSGAAAALGNGMKRWPGSGRVVLIGMGADDVSINVPLVQGRELTITGTFRYANTYPLALELIASGAVDVATVITHHFDIDHTVDALTLAARDPTPSKHRPTRAPCPTVNLMHGSRLQGLPLTSRPALPTTWELAAP